VYVSAGPRLDALQRVGELGILIIGDSYRPGRFLPAPASWVSSADTDLKQKKFANESRARPRPPGHSGLLTEKLSHHGGADVRHRDYPPGGDHYAAGSENAASVTSGLCANLPIECASRSRDGKWAIRALMGHAGASQRGAQMGFCVGPPSTCFVKLQQQSIFRLMGAASAMRVKGNPPHPPPVPYAARGPVQLAASFRLGRNRKCARIVFRAGFRDSVDLSISITMRAAVAEGPEGRSFGRRLSQHRRIDDLLGRNHPHQIEPPGITD